MATQAATTARRAPRTRRQFRCLDLPKVYSSYKITKDGQKKTIWIVDGREHDGSRYRLTRHSEAEAWALAREQQALNQQEFRLGTTLPMHVLVEAAETHRKGICIQEAVAFFEKNRPKTEQVLVKAATEAYVYDREKIQKCGAGVAQMKNMFKRFNAGFGNRFLHELSTKEIEQWLLAQQRPDGWKEFGPIGDERRNTILKLIRALFTFASGKARGWLPPDHNPAKDISLIKIVRLEPCTMSADETAQFLKLVPSFPKDVQAYAILRIFAPVRRCEFVGLDWSKLVSQNLRVLGKGKRRRTIPLEEVCMSWLRSLIKKSGPILERSLPKADDYLRDAFVKIGLRPESADDTDDFNPTKNILRHSACTYLNLIHGAATAARWAGHAEKIQQEHYIGLRDEDEANHWIKLTPDAVHRIQGLRIEYDNARETLETSHEGMKQDWPGTLIQFTDFLAEK
jgi:integrase